MSRVHHSPPHTAALLLPSLFLNKKVALPPLALTHRARTVSKLHILTHPCRPQSRSSLLFCFRSVSRTFRLSPFLARKYGLPFYSSTPAGFSRSPSSSFFLCHHSSTPPAQSLASADRFIQLLSLFLVYSSRGLMHAETCNSGLDESASRVTSAQGIGEFLLLRAAFVLLRATPRGFRECVST